MGNFDAIILNAPTALGSRENQVQIYAPQTGWHSWPNT
jgi:hypothetical protein